MFYLKTDTGLIKLPENDVNGAEKKSPVRPLANGIGRQFIFWAGMVKKFSKQEFFHGQESGRHVSFAG